MEIVVSRDRLLELAIEIRKELEKLNRMYGEILASAKQAKGDET